MKRFAFVSAAAEREYKALPVDVQDEFGKNLRKIQFDQAPELAIKHLSAVGAGVAELIINGSPAYRCCFIAKLDATVVVLHSFTKTTNGVDKHAMKIAKQRLKELMTILKEPPYK